MIITLFSMLWLAACHNSTKQVHYHQTGHFILADTVDTAHTWQYESIPMQYPIYYLGPVKDTIGIGIKYGIFKILRISQPTHLVLFPTHSNAILQIKVDTANVTDNPVEYLTDTSAPDEDSTRHYIARVVTIQNISDSIVRMGRTNSVYYMHLECKNRTGKWVAVQKNLNDYGLCLTNAPTQYLYPGEIIITKTTRLKGNFTTDCRLVFSREDGVAYSNIFRETIDEALLSGEIQ